jgi:hypothetical protein
VESIGGVDLRLLFGAASFSGLSVPALVGFAERLHISGSAIADLRGLALACGGAAASATLVTHSRTAL